MSLVSLRVGVLEDSSSRALEGFIKTALIIRKAPNFNNSKASVLDSVLSGNSVSLRNEVEGGIYLDENSAETMVKTFFALAAPSLDGKTQTAFVLDKVRPLYFALGATGNVSYDHIIQPIYLNYSKLNIAIQDLAEIDLKVLEKQPMRKELENEIKKKIISGDSQSSNFSLFFKCTSDELFKTYGKVEFLTLGLLCALVEDARKRYDTVDINSRPHWMKFHAERPELNFKGISIANILKDPDFFHGYCLYLDEYVGHDWAVLIRNLARSIGLKCVVSSTNAKIANLIGKEQSGLSGSKGPQIWSVVVNKLDSTNWDILRESVDESLDEAIYWIQESLKIDRFPDDLDHFNNFINDFIQNQLAELRPGVAVMAANAILSFSKRCKKGFKHSFSDFLDKLVSEIGREIELRKPNIMKKSAVAATFGLMLSDSFDRSYKEMMSIQHLCNYLENHLYYLINPADPKGWMFLTVASGNSEFPINFITQDKNSINTDTITLVKTPWKVEFTYFRSGELLTILACQKLIPTDLSIEGILEANRLLSASKGTNVGETRPKGQECYFSGNTLEVLSTVCFLDASHRNVNNPLLTFKGVSGLTYLKNLVQNLSLNRNDRININLEFGFDLAKRFNLFLFFEACHFPFLYTSNCELPGFFASLMGRNFNNRSVHVTDFNRTENKLEIDGQFSFFFSQDPNINPVYEANCVIECKNWAAKVSLKDLTDIIGKAVMTRNSKLGILVCNELSGFQQSTEEKFDEFINRLNINVYYLVKDGTNLSKLNFMPLSHEFDSPDMVYLIIERKNLVLIPEREKYFQELEEVTIINEE